MKTKVKTGTDDRLGTQKVCDYNPTTKTAKFYFTVDIENISESEFHEIREGDLANQIQKYLNFGIISPFSNSVSQLKEENKLLDKENKSLYDTVIGFNKALNELNDRVCSASKDNELKDFLSGILSNKSK